MDIGTLTTFVLLFISLFLEVFLLVSFLEKRVEHALKKVSEQERSEPSVCIVVPCFNEATTLSGTLHSLISLQYPRDKLEIIVVDDGSSDHTLSIARTFENSRPDRRTIRVFSKENGGKHTAMNLALSHTRAELIGGLDADSIVHSGALLRIVRVFDNREVAAVTPGIHVRAPQTLLQHVQHVEYRLSVFIRFMLASLGSAFITPGPFSIFRTSAVRALGGWRHGHSTEDMELALRIQRAGHLIANVPAAIVHTTVPCTIRTLFRQRVRWTYGFLRNAADYRNMIANRTYGNLGIMVLPATLISIGSALFFFVQMIWYITHMLFKTYARVELGILPRASFELYYMNTGAIWFLAWIAVLCLIILISMGALIGTGKRQLPLATPLFLLLYTFLVPLWLGTALLRAVFRTGVQWR